jgi:arylsulfatase A-like enzyme
VKDAVLRNLIRAGLVALLLFGIGRHAYQVADKSLFTRIPLKPLVVSEHFETSAVLRVEPGAAKMRSVVLITLDTTRPDRIGCYGNHDIATPRIDQLASEGAIFTGALATASTTLPTHASILTGRYPHRHGAPANSLFELAEQETTLAEVYASHGYDTAAFVSAFTLVSRFGLDQGFGVYDDELNTSETKSVGSRRPGNETTERAISWLRANRTKPYFLWVHYYDPHSGYDPPEPFKSDYALRYDGEIAFVDREVGRLVDAVRGSGEDEPLIVLTADHAEALGEHGEETHGYLVQEATLKIPLIFSSPGAVQPGVHVPTPTSQVDLLPTILSLTGIPIPEGIDGVDLTKEFTQPRPILAEALEGRVNFGWSRLSALYYGNHKYVEGPHTELYDLAVDPTEQENIADASTQLVSSLGQRLAALHATGDAILRPKSNGLSTAEREQLEALGYVVAGEAEIPAGGPGPDPRNWIGLLDNMFRAKINSERSETLSLPARMTLRINGIPTPNSDEEMIELVEGIAEDHPDYAPAQFYLSTLYRDVGRAEDSANANDRLAAMIQRLTNAKQGEPSATSR